MSTRLNAPLKTMPTTFTRSAPSAIRMPISFRALRYRVGGDTMQSPIAASSSATIPNNPARVTTARGWSSEAIHLLLQGPDARDGQVRIGVGERLALPGVRDCRVVCWSTSSSPPTKCD